jgi:uncharacterized protein YcgI (DUF1989 family)
MPFTCTEVIPASHGKAVRLKAGEAIVVRNTHGTQVVDTWAFKAEDPLQFMSMEHTRVENGRVMPKVGDSLFTNHREPILVLEEDTSPGIHDTLMAACDRWRYERLGCTSYHRNCSDNMMEGLGELGLSMPFTPQPLNLFMNIPIEADLSLTQGRPVGSKGDYVVLRAQMDCIVAFSACPQDITPINGGKPVDAHYGVIAA